VPHRRTGMRMFDALLGNSWVSSRHPFSAQFFLFVRTAYAVGQPRPSSMFSLDLKQMT
jgi:hypothetical protein